MPQDTVGGSNWDGQRKNGRAAVRPGSTLLTSKQVCAMLGISRSTLNRWVRDDRAFPQVQQYPGATIRWRRDEVVAYIANRPRVQYEDHAFDPNAAPGEIDGECADA